MENLENEIWVETYCSPNYEVSNFGRVRNVEKKLLKQSMWGLYLTCKLRLPDGKYNSKTIHQLVFFSFHNTHPMKGMVVDHIDSNHINNHLDNLQFITYSENSSKGKNHTNRKHQLPLYIRKEGKGFRVVKCFKQKSITFGTFKTLEEAVKKRDEFINSNWSLPIDHMVGNRRNIIEKDGKFSIVKKIDGSRQSFGTYSSIEEAIKKRNELIKSNWEIWEKPINPYQFIHRIRHKFTLRKSVNGINKRFGYFYTLEEAVKRRDELIASNWGIEN